MGVRRQYQSAVDRETPAELTEAANRLNTLDGVDVIRDWTWLDIEQKWSLICRLTIQTNVQSSIPARTDWVVLVDALYPFGAIHIHPRSTGGLAGTHPHQLYNAIEQANGLFTSGRICVDEGFAWLGRNGLDPEPKTVPGRLAWHLERARRWLVAASLKELRQSGDPFELPDFRIADLPLVAFAESQDSFNKWETCRSKFGLCEILRPNRSRRVSVVGNYRNLSGDHVYAPAWGSFISQARSSAEIGAWILLHQVVTVGEWQAPKTWGELFSATSQQDLDLSAVMNQLIPFVADDAPHILLLGFPIPRVVDGDAEEYFWSGIQLSPITSPTATRKGFRPGHAPRPSVASQPQFRPERDILWIRTENWHSDTIGARGRCSEALRTAEILLIGGGALGSAIAELLVRGGVTQLTMCDPDLTLAGNLVRHTLTLEDVGDQKAVALTRHLNALSPWARVRAISEPFPVRKPEHVALLRSVDIVIDCSAEDMVLAAIERYPWHQQQLFFSLSLGLYASRGFCFSARGERFPQDLFFSMLGPHLERQRETYAEVEWPREGLGCWHPVFPARADEVWAIASQLFNRITAVVDNEPSAPELFVAERGPDGEFRNGVDHVQ